MKYDKVFCCYCNEIIKDSEYHTHMDLHYKNGEIFPNEMIDYNLDEYFNQVIEYPENQFDLLFLDVQSGHFSQTGYDKLVYK